MSTQEQDLTALRPIRKFAYDAVKALQAKCEAEHRAPVCASINDIISYVEELVKAELNGLVKDGTLSWYRNVNGMMLFRIENPID